jgi:hypothetical protein
LAYVYKVLSLIVTRRRIAPMASGLDAFEEKVKAALRQIYSEKVIDHAPDGV